MEHSWRVGYEDGVLAPIPEEPHTPELNGYTLIDTRTRIPFMTSGIFLNQGHWALWIASGIVGCD